MGDFENLVERKFQEKKAKLGSGARFKKLEKDVGKKGKIRDPGAVAAAIGRKKYGQKKMTKLSRYGKKRAK